MPNTDTNHKIDVYNLGEEGVNLTKSPIHIQDGELVAAQNAEFYLDEGLGAIRKRPGLQRLNGSVLAGAVRGVLGVPLPGPGRRTVYVGDAGVGNWNQSNTGSSFAASSTDTFPGGHFSLNGSAYSDVRARRAVHLNRQFFYAAEDSSDSVTKLLGFDGVAEYECQRFAPAFQGYPLCAYQGLLVCAVNDTGAVTRVVTVDPITGETTQLGATFPATEEVYCAVPYLGMLWVGTANAASGRLHSIRPGQAAWTLERTAVANQHAYMSLAVYKGKLFAGTSALAGTAAIVEQRTVAGVWSTSQTGSHSTNANKYDALVVFGGELYAGYERMSGSPDICVIEKFNDVSWAQDHDIGADGGDQISAHMAIGASLFYGTVGATGTGLWRKLSGSWSKVGTFESSVIGVV